MSCEWHFRTPCKRRDCDCMLSTCICLSQQHHCSSLLSDVLYIILLTVCNANNDMECHVTLLSTVMAGDGTMTNCEAIAAACVLLAYVYMYDYTSDVSTAQ